MVEDFGCDVLQFTSGKNVQLDLFVAEKRLAFEYQGEQHYRDVFAFGPQWLFQARDMEKRKICEENGITLIEIPYWWDREKSSLIATIHRVRPDLLPNAGDGNPIPDVPNEAGKLVTPIKPEENDLDLPDTVQVSCARYSTCRSWMTQYE